MDERKVDVNVAMEAAARFGPDGSGGGATFINGMTMNIVSRSRYGRKAIGNMTRDIQQARNLVTAVGRHASVFSYPHVNQPVVLS